VIVRKFQLSRHNKTDRPFRIFAALLHRTLGDFTDQLVFACTMKENVENAILNVHYRPDRPYKEQIISVAPQVKRAWPLKDGIPFDFFDTAAEPPIEMPHGWRENICHYPDIVLTPSNSNFEKMSNFREHAKFTVPDASYWDENLRLKVSSSWFAVIHYRDPTYSFRGPQVDRDFNPQDALPVYDEILNAGGQVVRIGHKGMQPLPKKMGMIDLSEENFFLQTAAISHARFFFEFSPSGPSHLAMPFGCPLLRCNQTTIGNNFSDQVVVMPKRVIRDDGMDETLDFIQSGDFNSRDLGEAKSHRLLPNTPDQLLEGLSLLLRYTKDEGWRKPPCPKIGGQTGKLTFPMDNMLDTRLMI